MEKKITKKNNENNQSSISNLLFGVNKKISHVKNNEKENTLNKDNENIKKDNENKININQSKNKNEYILELKSECKTIEKELEEYAKKTLEELNITEKIKIKNINKLKSKLNLTQEKLQQELNIKYPKIEEYEPLVSFEEIQSKLKLRNNFSKIMKNTYKYEYPTSIQSISIPLIYQNKNVIAISETGSGKTLSYIIPCFHKI